MRFGVRYRGPMFPDASVAADERGGANHALDGLSLGVALGSPGAVRFHGIGFRIGQEHKRQVELRNESIMRIDTVSTYSEHHGISLIDGLYGIAEPACFFCSAGSVVLRIKIKDDVLSGVIG